MSKQSSNFLSSYQRHFNAILKFYDDTHCSIRDLLTHFRKHKNIAYDVLSTKDIIITDQIILELFVTTNKVDDIACLSKSTLLSFTKNKLPNKFISDVLTYLANRYSGSESFSETIARVYNKIEIRPVCKQCGAKLNYYSLNVPFQMFCSRSCSNNNEKTKFHLRQTCLAKYGVTNTAKAECVKQAYRDHMEHKYGKGILNAFQAKEVIKQAQSTKLAKYGSKTFNNRRKSEVTCLEKYGVENISQVDHVRHKQSYRYTYNGMAFDSAPEIAFYIWLNDVKDIIDIDFEYSPPVKFEYFLLDKKHVYMPDFRIGDHYFEIKGDHFFKDGKMICPYRRKDWTDEFYYSICAVYEAKHQCMIDNDVTILMSSDYKFFIDYVAENYGREHISTFKNY